MDSDQLDKQIDELEKLIYGAKGFISEIESTFIKSPHHTIGVHVADWRPVWGKAKEIQATFKMGIRYPTKSLRDGAWTRFNDLRNELSSRSNADRAARFEVSLRWRDRIFEMLHGTRYSMSTDFIFSHFDAGTTVEEMKQAAVEVREAGRVLSENKAVMLKEHKDECFQRIQEIRETHDRFWEKYREVRQQKQRDFQERIEAVYDNIGNNIRKNEEKIDKARDALERTEQNIAKLEGMIAGAYSDDFREKFEGYLAEAEERRDSILGSINRLDEWIAQDRIRRDDIDRKRRP